MPDNIDITVTEIVEDVDITIEEGGEINIDILEGQYVSWGDITGTLSDQTDLQSALDVKQDVLGFTPADSAITITGAGDLLTGQGGDLTANRVLTLNNSDIDHNYIANTHNLTTDINHNALANYEANEHIDWTNATNDLETSGSVTAEQFSGWGIVPIGGVVAWLKSFTGTPSLPDGWVECNGQVLNDADSVYNGRTMPQLNGYGGAGTNRFLRGSSTSGSTGGTESHRHDVLNYEVGFSLGLVYYYTIRSIYTYYAIAIPTYYEVVYIMRVK